jgi:hypothetical protein
MVDARSRKTGHGQSTGYHRHLKAILGKSRRNEACPSDMADPQQMLNIEEHAR